MFKERECESLVTITLKKTATLYWIEWDRRGQETKREKERKQVSPSKMEMLSGDIMNTVIKYHS